MKLMMCSVSLFCAMAFLGCSQNIPVTGKVVFNDDKTPLTKGVLIFDNGVQSGQAKIEPDGSFVVGFGKAGNGIPEGTWRVAIAGAEELLPCPKNEDKDPYNDVYPKPSKRLVAQKYDNIETSDLSIDVNKGTRNIEIGVDRPSKSRKK